jgi:hypothetical protein
MLVKHNFEMVPARTSLKSKRGGQAVSLQGSVSSATKEHAIWQRQTFTYLFEDWTEQFLWEHSKKEGASQASSNQKGGAQTRFQTRYRQAVFL